MRAGLDRQAEVELLVDVRIVVFARIVGARALGQRLYREHLDPFAVDRQLQFVLLRDRILAPPLTSKTLDVLIAIPVETHLKLIRPINREGIREDRAATRAQRKAAEMLLLRLVHRQRDDVGTRRANGSADREPADLLSRCEIFLHQGRREITDRDVVETEARVVWRKQRLHFDVDGEEITHRVAVFRACQPPERLGAPWIGIGGSDAIERGFQVRDQRLVRRPHQGAAALSAASDALRAFATRFPTSRYW